MRVLLTGIAGFIGSHTARWILEHTDWDLVGVESWKPHHKNSSLRLQEALNDLTEEQLSRLKVHRWDITHELTTPAYREIFRDDVDVIINMASDSHVTRSVSHPGDTWYNNCQLAFNVLEAARKHQDKLKMFVQISTDEVYGDAGQTGPGHPEWDAIVPSNPYSASKAAQEALAISYWRTYNVPVVITNCMNVVGEWQDPEKFLPMVINRVNNGETVTLCAEADGKTMARRCWMDVKNMAAALTHICGTITPSRYLESRDRPDRFHIVGEDDLDVLELATLVSEKIGKELISTIIQGDTVRPGYDRRYALEDNNLKATGFKHPFTFDDTIHRVVEWSKNNPNWVYE